MKILLFFLLILANVVFSIHFQSNPAFSNWANSGQNKAFDNWANTPQSKPTPSTNTKNPSFNNWINGTTTTNNNPAFNNWINKNGLYNSSNSFNNLNNLGSGMGGSQKAFNNWMNRPMNYSGLTNGRGAFNSWVGKTTEPYSSRRKNDYNNWVNNKKANSASLDRRFRAFLIQNRIKLRIPNDSQCGRYPIRNARNRYRVSCVLPNGGAFTEVCNGYWNCSMVTCKLRFCSRLNGGRLHRIGF